MKKSIGILSICLVLFFSFYQKVDAAGETIRVNHTLSNVIDIDHYNEFTVFELGIDVPLSDEFTRAEKYIEEDIYFPFTSPEYYFSYYFYQIYYIDGSVITGYSDTIKFSEIDNLEDVKEITFYYSDRGRVRVNRYLDAISDDNLIITEDSYGNYPVNFIDEYETIVIEGESLLVDPKFAGYELLSSDVDINNPIYYKDDTVVNLVYKKVDIIESNITISFVHKDGSILEEYTLSGEVGTTFIINDELFTLKDNYDLHEKPDVNSTVFSDDDQKFTFVYNNVEINERKEEIPKVENGNSSENNESVGKVDTKKPQEKNKEVQAKTPNTAAYNNLELNIFIIVFMTASIYILRGKKSKRNYM